MQRFLSALMSLSLVLTLSACSDDGLATGSDEQLGEKTTRIVGGSTYDGLPAVGALLYNGSQHCTGTLVAPRKVLTAGHCVDGFSASRMTFAIGPNAYSPQATVSVSSIEAHPGYNSYNITNDIGLVHLAQDAPVAPLGVVTQMDSSWVGTNLFFVGYGVSNGYNQTGAGLKRAVWMGVSSVNSTTFRYDDPDRNTCNGDSGGPAFYRDAAGNYLVAGVTSYGDAYCTQYGVDTRVDAFLPFLGLDDEPPVQQDPCQGETYEGRCENDAVIWCENDQVYRQDCASDGKQCGFAAENAYFACRESQPVDPCNGETFEGRCEAGSVIWCENDQVSSINCTAKGSSCGWSSSKGYYDCM